MRSSLMSWYVMLTKMVQSTGSPTNTGFHPAQRASEKINITPAKPRSAIYATAARRHTPIFAISRARSSRPLLSAHTLRLLGSGIFIIVAIGALRFSPSGFFEWAKAKRLRFCCISSNRRQCQVECAATTLHVPAATSFIARNIINAARTTKAVITHPFSFPSFCNLNCSTHPRIFAMQLPYGRSFGDVIRPTKTQITANAPHPIETAIATGAQAFCTAVLQPSASTNDKIKQACTITIVAINTNR